MNFSWALSLDPQGTNTMIKEAMNQQRFATMEESTLEGDIDDVFGLNEDIDTTPNNDTSNVDGGGEGTVGELEMSDI